MDVLRNMRQKEEDIILPQERKEKLNMVISEFSIKECMQCDYIHNSHVMAYTSLSLHISAKNSTLSDNNNHDLKIFEKTIEHLVHCSGKVYRTSASRKSCNVTPCSISNMHSHDLLEFKEEDLKEMFLCLKSSFTYAAKLLNLVLTSSSESTPPSPEAHNLANDLFDFIISVEEHLGSRYGSLVLSAAKLWLPDLILALGSLQIQKPSSSSSSAFAETKFGFPSWLLIVAKIEIFDQQETKLDENDEKVTLSSNFSTFRKVVETMIKLLRGNHSMLDAVGAFLLAGLDKKDFELLYGLLHFVCTRLVKHEKEERADLKLMLESLQQMYPQMKATAQELGNGHEKARLEEARSWVEPI
ncbi:hypothetical protein L1987_46958 [Smallanthus sonchifolius]|uniref:Uncharacterized protein n=1 Tax=Smallanthus sonchifolius TaxID=185202 RepID=A0ACB9G2Z8_9ASTR|nr:hypothetical protein L1987_46958 [Smallanthus sonchifolius]